MALIHRLWTQQQNKDRPPGARAPVVARRVLVNGARKDAVSTKGFAPLHKS